MNLSAQATPEGNLQSDVDVQQFALHMEYLANACYDESERFDFGATPSGASVNQLLSLIQLHTAAHIGTLLEDIASRGGTAAERPTFTFDITDQESFYAVAIEISALMVHAYHGSMHAIYDPRILVGASQFAAVNAKIAAMILALAGGNPLESAAPYLTRTEIQERARVFVVA